MSLTPFELINHVRAEFIELLERRYAGYTLVQAMDMIDGEMAFFERLIDHGIAHIYIEYPCKCGATEFNCVCDNAYTKHRNAGRYTPNTDHKRYT